MENNDIQKLAERHGLILSDQMNFNEMGIDFKVGFATDADENQWLLRIPRRPDLGDQIEKEKRILQLVSQYLSVQIPDWKVATQELVAYPLLKGKPVLTFDAVTYEIFWNMNMDNPNYIPSLARVLVQLHSIPREDVAHNGLKIVTPDNLRVEILERLHLVKSELGISNELEARCRKWLDNDSLWPNFTKFIHGDLYAGHVLTLEDGQVSGIIDWSTAQISDIAMDFSGHVIERAAAAPLAYGQFAIETKDDRHIEGAKIQLGVI